MTQPVNNGYTRCSECSEVYSKELKFCPKCNKPNQLFFIDEGNNDNSSFISENMNTVFNIND